MPAEGLLHTRKGCSIDADNNDLLTPDFFAAGATGVILNATHHFYVAQPQWVGTCCSPHSPDTMVYYMCRGVLMKAAFLTGIRQMEIRETAQPEISDPHSVLLRIGVVGVCGSDVHYYTAGRIGSWSSSIRNGRVTSVREPS